MNWQHSRLPGGLHLAQGPCPSPGLLAARLWINGGSSSDPVGQRGAHQLLAGVLTRGCGDLDAEALADLVEGCGAALRAEASEDHLLISLKCASEDAATLVPLLLEMATRPRLEPQQIAIERQLNLQTLQRQREDPFQLCHEGLRRQLYGTGPYGHDPLGLESELVQLEKPQLQQLQQLQGRLGGALVISGSLTADCASILSDTLGRQPWTVQPPHTPIPLQHGPQHQGEQLQIEDTEQVVLMLGCRVAPLSHPDNLPLRLLQAHLGLGMSSRLFLTMREERGLAYDVGVHMPARRGPTPFIWHLSTSADRAAEACTALLDLWQQLLETPLTPEELVLAQAKHRGQEAMGRQTCGQQADRQALLLTHGLPGDFIAQTLARSAELGTADLLAAARAQLQRPSLSLCGPPKGVEAAQRAWHGHPLAQARDALA
jgi:predicted Zn-dependent peptidase